MIITSTSPGISNLSIIKAPVFSGGLICAPSNLSKDTVELARVYDTIRAFIDKAESIKWGYDGDCGLSNCIVMLETILPENTSRW